MEMDIYKWILVVDNEPQFLEALRVTLAAKSYRVVTATDRTRAQAMVGKGQFDALVLGTLTPRGEAFAFHQWLKRNPSTRSLPFLVLDARPDRQLLEGWRRDEGMQLEADDYLAKPVEPAMLVPRIERLLEMVPARIKVLVVDDHTVVREGIRAVLMLQRDMQVVGEAVDGEDAIKQALKLSPDVVLMDIVMPSKGGLEATEEICRECPDAKVLILTQYDDKQNLNAAGHAGARGFIPKRAASSQLVAGIRSVYQGQYFQHEPIIAA
jgi:DNA-binding NarL/FixJ family response regulator